MENIDGYIVYINGALNLAVIGFVIRFSLFMKTAFKEKEDVFQKRIDAIDEDLKRTEKWAGRNQEDLKSERDKLQNQLDKILIDADVDMNSYNLLNAVQKIGGEFKSSLKEISEKIEILETKPNDLNSALNISMAKAFASNGEWSKAAYQYDLATRGVSDSWELYFYKGIAYANSRGGEESYLKALQAYADAVVYLPKDIERNLRARLFIYKGALLKRLNRTKEAENYILLGLQYATANYEVNDGLYNLACIYAMNGDTDNFEKTSIKLRGQDSEKYEYLQYRVKEYAPKFNLDKQFCEV